MLKAIFFDAVGTLFYLTKTVGDHYAFVAERGWPEVGGEETGCRVLLCLETNAAT